MTYEAIPNARIIAGVAVPGVFTSYELRMAAGERIAQQAEEIAALRAEVERLRAALQRLVAQVPNIEVMGEWSALDINITSGKKVRAEVDAAVAQARAALAKGEQP